MPRRNFVLIIVMAFVSLACYHRAARSPYPYIMAEALSYINARYVKEVDDRKLFESAMKGMVAALNDPNSAYESPGEYQKLNEGLEQKIMGVGVSLEIDPATKQLMVLSPVVGSPAYKAGIRAGDRITHVDGAPTAGGDLSTLIQDRIKGVYGQPVAFRIEREGEAKPLEITVVRGTVPIESVLGDLHLRDGAWSYVLSDRPDIGYIRIVNFGMNTASEFERALKSIDGKVKGLVIDLRNNPGGMLPAAVEVCSRLIEAGEVVSTRLRNDAPGKRHEAFTNRYKFPLDVPIVVLVNQYTASASEIVAACLQDHGRATIVGERSYGKGTVQEIFPLEGDRSAIKITTARYWRPSGKNIDRRLKNGDGDDWGVSPDAKGEVALDDKTLERVALFRRRRDVVRDENVFDADRPPNGEGETPLSIDPQLRRAVEIIESAER